jgi:hypothetical protein
VISLVEVIPVISYKREKAEFQYDMNIYYIRNIPVNLTVLDEILTSTGDGYIYYPHKHIYFTVLGIDVLVPFILYNRTLEKHLNLGKMKDYPQPGLGEVYILRKIADRLNV